MQNAALNGAGDRFTALRCGADLSAPEPLEENGIPLEERKFEVYVETRNNYRNFR